MLRCDRCHEEKESVQLFQYRFNMPSLKAEYALRERLEFNGHKIGGMPKLCAECQVWAAQARLL